MMWRSRADMPEVLYHWGKDVEQHWRDSESWATGYEHGEVTRMELQGAFLEDPDDARVVRAVALVTGDTSWLAVWAQDLAEHPGVGEVVFYIRGEPPANELPYVRTAAEGESIVARASLILVSLRSRPR